MVLVESHDKRNPVMKPTQPDSRDAFDFDQWKETDDVELKLAAGKDGRGALPDSIWETYSAMANTAGGTIVPDDRLCRPSGVGIPQDLFRMGLTGLEKAGVPGGFQPFADLFGIAYDVASSR